MRLISNISFHFRRCSDFGCENLPSYPNQENKSFEPIMSFAFFLLLIIVGTFSMAVVPTAGQTLEWDFYVSNFGSDSGRGTEGDPFETISQALLSMEQIINIAGPTVSAVRIYLLAGIFSGPGNQQLSLSIPKRS